VDVLMCNSCYTQKAIMDSWGRKAELVYPPVDVENFKPAQKESLVVSIGRFTPVKNYELTLQVAKRLPDVKFIIVGRKTSNDPYFDKLAALKPDNVDLIAGATRAEVSILLGRAKIYLHSMIGEHFGISVVEAMAAGCIPVVHNSGGPKEAVGNYGFLYNNVEECVKAIAEALQSNVNSNDIAEQAKMFSTDNFKKNFIKILESHGFL
ncbi:MAG: glycosyltransferase, partial [Nitrososphaerota archaeon]|nr:glycosyltransferase [Nitrososphaerota archaeon]